MTNDDRTFRPRRWSLDRGGGLFQLAGVIRTVDHGQHTITPAGKRVLAEWIASPSKQLTFEFEAALKVPFADNSSIEQLRATLDTLAGGLDTGLAEVQPYLRAIVDDGFGFQPQAHLSAMSIALIERLMVATYEWAVRAREIADGWDNVESTPEKEAWAHDVYRSVLTNLEPDPATQPGN